MYCSGCEGRKGLLKWFGQGHALWRCQAQIRDTKESILQALQAFQLLNQRPRSSLRLPHRPVSDPPAASPDTTHTCKQATHASPDAMISSPFERLPMTGNLGFGNFPDPSWCASHTQAVRDSLQRLQTPYLDLYLIHSPFLPEGASLKGVWQQMEACVDQGLVKSIGVSNFRISDLEELFTFARIRVSHRGFVHACRRLCCDSPLLLPLVSRHLHCPLVEYCAWDAIPG